MWKHRGLSQLRLWQFSQGLICDSRNRVFLHEKNLLPGCLMRPWSCCEPLQTRGGLRKQPKNVAAYSPPPHPGLVFLYNLKLDVGLGWEATAALVACVAGGCAHSGGLEGVGWG